MKPTILFAENESGIRRYLQQEFQADGYHVLTAADGIEALDTLETAVVDLVIIDEHMPRCGGLEAVSHIRRWYPNMPVILYTADSDLERYTGGLVDATVIKSEDPADLKAVVVRLLEHNPRRTTSLPFNSPEVIEYTSHDQTSFCG